MKIRHFITYFWFILMFIGSSFGIFYLITGQNIITGQTREITDVLPAKDEKKNNLGEKVKTNDPNPTSKPTILETRKESLSPELLLFNSIMPNTSNKSSFKLLSKKEEDSSAAVFFRFGIDTKSQEYQVAVYASGLDDKKKYFAWLTTSSNSLKLGELKKMDDSGVIKLGYLMKRDTDYLSYTKAAVTAESDEKNEDLKTENVLFTADLKFTSLYSTPFPTVSATSKPNSSP